jgi:hypothetical protein
LVIKPKAIRSILVERWHIIFTLSLILSGIIFGLASKRFPDYGSLVIGFTSALITAAIVDIVYNYFILIDINEMIAKHLMLNEDVQNEIMTPETIEDILDCYLDSTEETLLFLQTSCD